MATEQTQGILEEIGAQRDITDTSKGYSSLTYWAGRYATKAQRAVPAPQDRPELLKAAGMLVAAIEMIDNEGAPPPAPPEEPTPETPEG